MIEPPLCSQPDSLLGFTRELNSHLKNQGISSFRCIFDHKNLVIKFRWKKCTKKLTLSCKKIRIRTLYRRNQFFWHIFMILSILSLFFSYFPGKEKRYDQESDHLTECWSLCKKSLLLTPTVFYRHHLFRKYFQTCNFQSSQR